VDGLGTGSSENKSVRDSWKMAKVTEYEGGVEMGHAE